MLPESIDSILFVSTFRNMTLLENIIYKACIIEITGRELSIDVIALDTRDFE